MRLNLFPRDGAERPVPSRRGAAPTRRDRGRRPAVEALEDRRLLTTVSDLTPVSAGAGPLDVVVGPDNNLWITEFKGNRIARVTTGGTVTEFSTGITAGSRPVGIVPDNAGNLWFTEFNASQVGRITTSGTVTEFSTGITANSSPTGIAADNAGNLWFTEFDGDQIGRITPAGVVTEFSTGITGNAGAAGIVLGPDGNMWFTEFYAGKVGRITPAGVVTEFATGITPNSQPAGITVGPDNNLWFTELAGGRVARITTAGVVTEFSAGITPGSGPAGITKGPDGALWFTEYNDGRVGRITTAGAATELAAGTATSTPAGIVTGPDGRIYFARETAGTIGVIDLSVTGPVATQTTLMASPTPWVVGQTVTFTATVVAPEGGTPTGQVVFHVDGVDRPAVNLQVIAGADAAVLNVSDFAPGTHKVSASYVATTGFSGSDSNTITQDVLKLGTTARLGSAPNPSTAGQAVTFSVVVAPTGVAATGTHARQGPGPLPFAGSVEFREGNTSLGFAQVAADGTASLPIVITVPGTHHVMAFYSGDGDHAPTVSNAVDQVVRAPTDGPRVGAVLRYGFHWMPTTLVLTFNGPLDPARAQNRLNYLIVGPGGRFIPVGSAVYVASAHVVVLSPVERLDLHKVYRLVVVGTGPYGLTDPGGVPLDGAGNGRPGSNFVTTVTMRNWVLAPLPFPVAPWWTFFAAAKRS